MKIISKSLIILSACLAPAIVLAQGLKDAGTKLGAMGGQGVALSSNFSGITGVVATTLFSLVGTIFFIFMIYGGFVWLKAAGREDEISRAKRIVTTSLIGIAVIMASYAITNFVLARLAGSSSGGKGETNCIEQGGTCVDTADICARTGPEGGVTGQYSCPSKNQVCCLPK